MYSHLVLELISNFTPQDMSAELQKALSTKQNPNLVLKETKGSPVVFVKRILTKCKSTVSFKL